MKRQDQHIKEMNRASPVEPASDKKRTGEKNNPSTQEKLGAVGEQIETF